MKGALPFILAAMLSSAVSRLTQRYVMKNVAPFAYSWVVQLVSTFLFLPLALFHWELPMTTLSWVVLAGASILWVLVDLTALTSFKKTEVSIREPVTQSKLLWTLIFGILFLGEREHYKQKIIASIIVVVGAIILIL